MKGGGNRRQLTKVGTERELPALPVYGTVAELEDAAWHHR